AGALAKDAEQVQAIAAAGVSGPGSPMPHADTIKASFGRFAPHVDTARAYTDAGAAAAAASIGAAAYATGNRVAFDSSAPDLHTPAHETGHVVQQAQGVNLYDGVGQAGDQYERHADRVADEVVAGRSAERMLDELAGDDHDAPTASAVQRVADRSA